MKEAVLALMFNEDKTKIIGVSRKDDQNAFGLVGGKVEPNETHISALYREVLEETGLKITKAKKIFKQFDGNMDCTTYICDYYGEINTNEAGVVKLVTWEELFNGPFGSYNRELYNLITNE